MAIALEKTGSAYILSFIDFVPFELHARLVVYSSPNVIRSPLGAREGPASSSGGGVNTLCWSVKMALRRSYWIIWRVSGVPSGGLTTKLGRGTVNRTGLARADRRAGERESASRAMSRRVQETLSPY